MRHRLVPLLAVLCAAVAACGRDEYEPGDGDEAFCSWTCAIFTLQWPGGFCQSLDNASLCQIPQRVSTWMIHGLWPMNVRECCGCWPMFLSDVQELREALENRWPSLLKSRSGFHFWRDEWEKHGACAACVEGLNSPLRYFQTCLKLRQYFDLHKVLEGGGIRPSCDRTYKLTEVQDVLFPLVGDKCEIQCVKDEQEREVWFQVKILLSRNLTVGCRGHGAERAARASTGHPCPARGTFYFLPINHERPLRPCG
ncbi:ribonuclease T2-like [Hippocampus zosterae]|uniref:ribonuclease T2-like n=1 Tax=Hippocampus zosterae TaxID=109293 RepID=UPI00223CB7E3|nr:ribonuclease T2-like [Hippocampus zosterae]XP_051934137.1 ribonuclease T2-like [Hippocampus zosterae]